MILETLAGYAALVGIWAVPAAIAGLALRSRRISASLSRFLD